MANPPSPSGGLPVSRRDALKGLAGVGAASILAQQSDRVTSLVQSDDDRELLLPVENVREVWGHWDSRPYWDLPDLYTEVPEFDTDNPLVTATRGLKQTNLLAVDDSRSWRNDCNGVPGIEHRFTAIGYYRGISGADLTISVDDSLVEDCGSVALTPNYFYYTDENTEAVQNAERHNDHQQMVTDLEGQIDRRLSEEDPRRMESMIAGAELVTGMLKLAARTPHPAVQAAAVALTVASFVHSLSKAERELEHDIESNEIALSIDSTGLISTFFVDFSVVVPSGAEDVTVEVAHSVDGVAEMNTMEPDDLTFTVDLPPIEHDQDPGDLAADQVPTIETSGGPLAVEEASDGALTATAEPPDDAIDTKAWQVDDAFTGDRGAEEITTSALDPGIHSVRYVGHGFKRASTFGPGYICERLVQTGDPYYYEIPPSVVIEGPRRADVEETVTFEGSASSPNGVDSHRWEVVTDKQGVGTVMLDSQVGEGSPDPFEVTLPGDNYRVELTVTDGSSEALTATARQQLRVFDRVYDVSILAPETVPAGQSVPIEFEIEGEDEAELGYDAIVWSGALNEADELSFEHTFEETGEQTLEVFVLDTDNNHGRAERTIEVVEESPVEVSIEGPAEAEPGETVTYEGSASSLNGDVETYVWEVTTFPRGADGPVTEVTEEGTGPIEAFETSLEGDVYHVHLHVTDEYGVRGTASHDLDVHRSLDVDIQAPSEIPVDESATFSVDIAGEDEDELGYDAITWSGAFIDSGLETDQSFGSPGERTVEVRVITTENARGTAEHSFDVLARPTADIDGPTSGETDDELTFDAFDSEAPGSRTIDDYDWTVDRIPNETGDNGDQGVASGSGSTFSFTPDEGASTYQVTLTVTSDGVEDSAEHDVVVKVPYVPPTATIDGPTSGIYGEPFEDGAFDGSDSRGSLPIEYDWTVDRPTNGPGDKGEKGVASGSKSTFSFTPDDGAAGLYVVKLSVEDAEGNTDETKHDVSVSVE